MGTVCLVLFAFAGKSFLAKGVSPDRLHVEIYDFVPSRFISIYEWIVRSPCYISSRFPRLVTL